MVSAIGVRGVFWRGCLLGLKNIECFFQHAHVAAYLKGRWFRITSSRDFK
jgi:hypothetical protein